MKSHPTKLFQSITKAEVKQLESMSGLEANYSRKLLMFTYTNCYDVRHSSRVVSAKPWVVVAVMAMMCLMPYQSVDLTSLSGDPVSLRVAEIRTRFSNGQ